jgi:hypothetical protein
MTMLFDSPIPARAMPITLYTEQFIVRGTIQTLQHRVTDILNEAHDHYLVLEDVALEEYASAEIPTRAEFAQVNLASVLFAVSLTSVESVRELRTPKLAERALISVPPFRVVGHVHLPVEGNLRDSLAGLHGAFIPVTDATFWSDRLREARQTVAYIAVNHDLAQFFAPFREVDPWAGVARPADTDPEPPPAG